jgi:hypothetical protein
MPLNLKTIQEIIHPLVGHPAWNVKLGVGSFVTMEFGNRISLPQQKQRGEWHLWIYCCGWFLIEGQAPLIGSEDSRELLQEKITVLNDRVLKDVTISSDTFETNFEFDGDLTLHTFPLHFVDDDPYWMLFTPDGNVLIIGPAGKWFYQKSSQSRP